jgi:hypothetical protein
LKKAQRRNRHLAQKQQHQVGNTQTHGVHV